MEIHIWDLSNMPKINIAVDIKDPLKDEIKDKITNQISLLARELKVKPARLYEYFIWKISAIPLNILLAISNKLQISKQKIEKNIIMYKQLHVPFRNSIKNPKLPIKISPYFTSIVAHLFFDGSMPRDGKGTYYNQKNKEIMNIFIKKINHIFGEVSYSLKKDHRGVLKCRIPRIIGEVCKHFYNIDSFETFKAKIPKSIFKLNQNHKIAFILSAILDEGSITYGGQIGFGICNKLLCKDVKKLCNQVGLKTTKVKQKSRSNYYYFYIKSKDKLLKLANFANKKNPLIFLSYKKERLGYYFKIKKYPGLRTKEGGNLRKKRILEALKEKPKSVNQLAVELLIPPRSLRRHLTFLMDEGKVEKIKVGKEYFYSMTPH